MKIVITGAGSGIGKAIADKLSQAHEVKVLDIADGYDIGDLSLIKHILDADIFINNAFSKQDTSAQQTLFETIFSEWKYTNKHIINMGSLSRYYEVTELTFERYTLAKKALNDSHNSALIEKGRTVKLTQICPGYTDTDMIKDFDVPKMNVQIIADAAEYAINQGINGTEIADLTIAKGR